MADALPTSNSYQMLGGINDKASRYRMSTAQFLDLRNMDFDVPNALQKRPGSTQAVSAGTSGPIQSLFEFIKLTGESYVVAASDTALFYIQSNQYTLLSGGWNNGQPADMLTFVNKLWVANGQSWISWQGTTAAAPVGLPAEPLVFGKTYPGALGSTISYLHYYDQDKSVSGGSYILVAGATNIWFGVGVTSVTRGIYVAYSFVRSDGYQGPAEFLSTARNVVRQTSLTNGSEFFTDVSSASKFLQGFTVPSGLGITAINLWVGVDTQYSSDTPVNIPGVGFVPTGKLGWQEGGVRKYSSYSLKPDADLTRFWLFTTIPTSNLFASADPSTGVTFWCATFIMNPPFSAFDGIPPLTSSFSGMPFNFFATYIPKYIEVSQNVMFSAGFSAQPSTVWFSDIGEPETVQPDNFFEVRTNDGDKIYAIKAFNNQLIVAKEHSFSKLIGSSADNFQLVDLSTDYGCISNRTMLTKDQTLYWLDKKGILEFNGANWTIVSQGVEGIFRRMNVNAAKEKACGVHNLYRNQLWWGIPIDGSTVNNITVVYDYLVGAWTFFDGFNPASFALAKGALSRPTAWRGDYSGLVHYTDASFYSDSGRGITCLAFTKFENVGGENQTTLWRRLFLDVAPDHSGVTGTINCQMFTDYNTTAVQHTAMATQDQFQTRFEMGVNGKAIAAQFSHSSASLPLLINGYGFASRGLRND